MASLLQVVALVGLVVGVCAIWGWEWAVLSGSLSLLLVGVALEVRSAPRSTPGDG